MYDRLETVFKLRFAKLLADARYAKRLQVAKAAHSGQVPEMSNRESQEFDDLGEVIFFKKSVF